MTRTFRSSLCFSMILFLVLFVDLCRVCWAFPGQQQQQQHHRADLALLSPALANFWYPVHFSSTFKTKATGPFELLGEKWVLWKNSKGTFSCVLDQCPHRGARLSLGNVNPGTGCLRCAYHGWELGVDGKTTATPSTGHLVQAQAKTLPSREYEGLLWVWPGEKEQERMESEWNTIKHVTTLPPPGLGYTMHGELDWEFDVDHSLMIDNVCDVAHIPFIHKTSFGRRWTVPEVIKFRSRPGLFASSAGALGVATGGVWDPYPIDHGFQPPCIVLSNSGVKKKGEIGAPSGTGAEGCSRHFHQLHICLPTKPGHLRLLYRLHSDFLGFTKYIPRMDRVWEKRARVPVMEDFVVMQGQQVNIDRHGARAAFAHPCEYDRLSFLYRKWRDSIEIEEASLMDQIDNATKTLHARAPPNLSLQP